MKVKLNGLYILIFLFFSGWMPGKYIIGKTLSVNNTKKKPKIFLESLSFNHDTGCNTCDAINIRKNFHEDVHIPEWKRGEKSYPAAYIKNKCVTVKAIFTADRRIEKAIIRAERNAGDLGNLEQTIVFFENGISKPVYFRVPGKTPGEIKSFIQEWDWYYSDINCSGSGKVYIGRSRNEIFIVLAEPQSPWQKESQTEPWSEALAWSCKWAKGETTPEGAAEKITKALFKTIGGLYDIQEGSSRYTSDRYEEPFALTNFIDHFPKIGIVNCYDMGKSLVAFSNVVGCGLSYQYSSSFGYLNCIYAIGRGWTNNPFYKNKSFNPAPIVDKDSNYDTNLRSGFGNHAFGGISDHIFDACLTVNTSCVPDYGPPFKETWMIAQPWNWYKLKVVDKNPASNTRDPVSYLFTIY